MQRKVIRKTKIFNGDGQYRNDAPVNMLIEGRQDGTHWVCIFPTSSPVVMKVGWYVAHIDTVALTGQLPPDPQPVEDVMVHYRGGVEVERFQKVSG